jgi:hypothetical protein
MISKVEGKKLVRGKETTRGLLKKMTAPSFLDGAWGTITTRPSDRDILCLSSQDRTGTYCFQNSSWQALQEAPTLLNWALMASISPEAATFCSSLVSLI